MRTDRFSAPVPPEVLLSAYQVEFRNGRAASVAAAHRVADLAVLDGYLCVALRRAGGPGGGGQRTPDAGSSWTPAPIGGDVPGELVVADLAAVRGAGVGGAGVRGAGVRGAGVRGAGVRGTAQPAGTLRVPLPLPPAALAVVGTNLVRRVFVLAEGGGAVIPLDLPDDAHGMRPGEGIVLEPAPGSGHQPWPRPGGCRSAPDMAAHSGLGRVYVSDPLARRVAVIDAHRLTALRGEEIELPGPPTRIVVDEQDRTLFALLASRRRPELAVVDLVTGDLEMLALDSTDLRDLAYDNESGLIFVATGGAGANSPGVLVLDRDTGRAAGGPIRTGDVPTALAVLRAPGATLLFCCGAASSAGGGRVEVVDVAHRAVVGSAPVVEGCDRVAVDGTAGDVLVAGGTGRITRLAPSIGGTPIARHPAVVCAGAGPPLGGLRRTPDGTGWLQPFCRGTAVATNDIGAVLIDADHAEHWLTNEAIQDHAESTVGGGALVLVGTDTGDRLGNPVADTMTVGGRRVSYFERGMVLTGLDRGQLVRVAGPVYMRYREMDDIAGPLGPPVESAVAGETGAIQQTFARGHIVHHPQSGTQVLAVADGLDPGCSEWLNGRPVAVDLVGSRSSGGGVGNFATILLTGGAGVVQVTDEAGHRLPATTAAPAVATTAAAATTVATTAATVSTTAATGAARGGGVPAGIPGLLRLARLPRHSGAPGGELFSADGEHAGLRFDVAADTGADGTGEYCWAVWMAGCAATVTAIATTVPDRLTAEHVGTPGRGISVEVPRDGSARPFAIGIRTTGGTHPRSPHVRQYFLDEVTITAGQRIFLRIDDGGAELLATNHGPPTSVLLRIGTDDRGRPSPPRRARIAAGATTVFRPLDWSAQGIASRVVSVEVRETPNGPARVAIAVLGSNPPDDVR